MGGGKGSVQIEGRERRENGKTKENNTRIFTSNPIIHIPLPLAVSAVHRGSANGPKEACREEDHDRTRKKKPEQHEKTATKNTKHLCGCEFVCELNEPCSAM